MTFEEQKGRTYNSESDEHGAVVVEATLSLSFFMFAIFTLLSVVSICYAQARINTAVDCAAKEMSEYTHLYYCTHMSEAFGSKEGKSTEIANKVGHLLERIGGKVDPIDKDFGSLLTDSGKSIEDDSITDYVKLLAVNCAAKHLTGRNLVSASTGSADTLLKHFHVKNGLEGIDFTLSNVATPDKDNKGDNICLVAQYHVNVIKLFKWNIGFDFKHGAYTQAWANGE